MRVRAAMLLVAVMALAGCGVTDASRAEAEIKDSSGQFVGRAVFTPAGEDQVRVYVDVKGLTPGAHGIHVHERGECEPPEFTSAGAHFNPSGEPHHGEHGAHHAGDLPNLQVGPDGTGKLDTVLPGITMKGRGHHSLFHLHGTSILIHRDADDLKTAPSGNSGDRIACGVINAVTR